jgi:GNAT superfamily N-acetyltransferase
MTRGASPKPGLRPFLPVDVPVLAEIYQASIEELTGEDYSEAQQAAWASRADDEEAFGARLAGLLTLVATIEGTPVGFAALRGTDHIEMLFVHPAAAGQGIGAMLYDALEKLAGAARPFADGGRQRHGRGLLPPSGLPGATPQQRARRRRVGGQYEHGKAAPRERGKPS